MATGPNFYQIDFEREVVYQGKTTSFLTIRRNDSVMTSNEKLYVMVYPQINTFELETTIKAVGDGSSSYVTIPYGSEFYPGDGSLSFNNIAVGQKLKNFYTVSNDEVVVSGVELQYPSRDIKVSFTGANGNVPVAPSGTSTFYLGQYSQDSSQWFINGVNAKSMQDGMYSDSSVVDYSTLLATMKSLLVVLNYSTHHETLKLVLLEQMEMYQLRLPELQRSTWVNTAKTVRSGS